MRSVSLCVCFFLHHVSLHRGRWRVSGDLYWTRLEILPGKFDGEVQGGWRCGSVVIIQWWVISANALCHHLVAPLKDLGINFDSSLFFIPHIHSIGRSYCYFQSISGIYHFFSIPMATTWLSHLPFLVPESCLSNWSPCPNSYYPAIHPTHGSQSPSNIFIRLHSPLFHPLVASHWTSVLIQMVATKVLAPLPSSPTFSTAFSDDHSTPVPLAPFISASQTCTPFLSQINVILSPSTWNALLLAL